MDNNSTLLSIFEKNDVNLEEFDDTNIATFNVDEYKTSNMAYIKEGILSSLDDDLNQTSFIEPIQEKNAKKNSNSDSYSIKKNNMKIISNSIKKEMISVSKSIKTINHFFNRIISYDYFDVIEYSGVVEEVLDGKFKASLKRSGIDCTWQAYFKINELRFTSDIELLKTGALFTLKSGQKYNTFKAKDGKVKTSPYTNFYEIKFRIPKKISSKELKKINEESESWIEFFNS